MKKIIFWSLFVVVFSSCSLFVQRYFVRATDGGTWTTVELRDGLDYDKAWNEAIDVVAKKFEMEMISKEGAMHVHNGFIRGIHVEDTLKPIGFVLFLSFQVTVKKLLLSAKPFLIRS